MRTQPAPEVFETLSLTALRFPVGNGSTRCSITLSLEPGERVAVLGENGAGKSTFLRALLGVVRAQWDGLTIAGMPVTSASSHRRARRSIAWIPQSPEFGEFPVCARDLFDLSGSGDRGTEFAEQLGVRGLVDFPVREVSGGQLQRLLLARAFGQLTGQASLLLADEPSTGLDDRSVGTFLGLLKQTEVSALVVTHDDRLLSSCDRVLRLRAGALVSA